MEVRAYRLCMSSPTPPGRYGWGGYGWWEIWLVEDVVGRMWLGGYGWEDVVGRIWLGGYGWWKRGERLVGKCRFGGVGWLGRKERVV